MSSCSKRYNRDDCFCNCVSRNIQKYISLNCPCIRSRYCYECLSAMRGSNLLKLMRKRNRIEIYMNEFILVNIYLLFKEPEIRTLKAKFPFSWHVE